MPRTDAPAPPTAVARTDSPLGPIELRARRGALTGLRFVGAWPLAPAPLAPVPSQPRPARRRPRSGPLAAATVATGAPADAVQFAGPAAGGVRAGTAVDRDVLDAARRQLDEYFAGRRRRWALAVEPGGTPFQRAVWAALERLPYGTTTTYGALAAELGRPGAARAVGAANGRNPISVVVPCHRVVGAGAGLTGYAWGLERKAWLLALERDG